MALASCALLWAPAANASILLSAEEFALLGGAAITGTGVAGTVIANGDVGLSTGPTTGITGFPPAVIQNGAIIATGSDTGEARIDLITAQAGLALLPSDTNMSGVDLGGLTLTTGVYTFSAAPTLNGALVLDGQGLDDAFWVFQIGSSLTTSVGSSIIVINAGPSGGSDYGIFWNAGTEIVIGANNAVLGNYLSGTSITMGSQSSGSGRALALGAIALDQNAIDAHGGPEASDWTGGLDYDQLGIVVPVPESSSALLFGLGIYGFMLMGRKRFPQQGARFR